jgi:hypothetical protein
MTVETELQQALAPPASTPAAGNEPSGTPGAEPATGTAPATEPDELPASIKELIAKNPASKEIVDLVNREMKGAWTPRLQEAAELRKRVEGVDDQSIGAIRYFNQLAKTDPAAAAQWLRSQADALHRQEAATQQQTPDPYAGIQPQTEAEKVLLDRMREQDQWRQQQERSQQERQQLEAARAVGTEMNQIAAKYGVEIPIAHRQAVFDIVQKTGMKVEDAYFATARDTLLPQLLQKARDQAASVTQEKLGGAAGNPGSITNRAGEQPQSGPGDFRSIMAREMEAGAT